MRAGGKEWHPYGAGEDRSYDQDRTPGKVTGGMREDDGDQPVLVFKTPDRCKKEDGGSIDQNKRKESGDGEINRKSI